MTVTPGARAADSSPETAPDHARPLFDIHVMIDWSASASPTLGRDSIWRAVRHADEPDRAADLVNHPTRRAAYDALVELIDATPGRRMLVGVDFPLGYPAGVATALEAEAEAEAGVRGGVGAGARRGGGGGGHERAGERRWRRVWSSIDAMVIDDEHNRNNRFEVGAELNRRLASGRPTSQIDGPFWGHPPGRRMAHLRPTKPTVDAAGRIGGFPEFRRTELVLRSQGRRPFSVWQLAYAGSVGGQALVGIPVVAAVAAMFPDRVRIWPFETGLSTRPAEDRDDAVVIAEMWPSSFGVDRGRHAVLDAAQVLHVTAVTASADRRGDLPRWFAPAVDDLDAVVNDEGWTLGVI